MDMAEKYIKLHQVKKSYCSKISKNGFSSFYNMEGWTDFVIDKSLIYSHRKNSYTKKIFTEGLHAHDYYELLIYVNGDVRYIKDDILLTPNPFSAVWFLPGQIHTATLNSPSEYERYVFYFTKDFFRYNSEIFPITEFMGILNSNILTPDISCIKEISSLLNKIDSVLSSEVSYNGLLAKAFITELFSLLNSRDLISYSGFALNDTLTLIKNHIDKNYASITSVSDIAKKFHYSREHISRIFKDRFNISISDYLAKRRILESLPLIGKMTGAEISYKVGFKSQSAFISAFYKNTGALPSEYKKRV